MMRYFIFSNAQDAKDFYQNHVNECWYDEKVEPAIIRANRASIVSLLERRATEISEDMVELD